MCDSFKSAEVSPWKATREKIRDPTPGSSISATGVWRQVTTPLESDRSRKLHPAILGMGPIRIGRTESNRRIHKSERPKPVDDGQGREGFVRSLLTELLAALTSIPPTGEGLSPLMRLTN